MNGEESVGQCFNCGEEILWSKIGTRFCSVKCHDDYHNAQRKIDRKIDRVAILIKELQELTDGKLFNLVDWNRKVGIYPTEKVS